ncbi:sensor histidine kinase [Taibaiella chishuiensis]|uniref:Histidine kinase n=1 Tax=Taibaiella chishuiensis TaxID=1434707 RepID=A0A2P8D2V7_9BACT|nr:histidine kinase [Taibaiella chishuiensis]PSK91568.1 histidine kinase [Taibaiella chishuiensis]
MKASGNKVNGLWSYLAYWRTIEARWQNIGPGMTLWYYIYISTTLAMKRHYKIALHLFYWFCFFGWSTLSRTLYNPAYHFDFHHLFGPLNMAEYLVFMGTFYLNYCFIMPRFFKQKQYKRTWTTWFLLLLFFICFRYFVEQYLLMIWFHIQNYYEGVSIDFFVFDNLYFGSNVILMSVVFWAIDNWMKIQKEKTALEQEKATAELDFLKSQLNPHFLFNTLNNIYSLVYHQSDKTLPAILKLSELMRYMTRESTVDSIELSRELEYIESFIALESLRTVGTAAVQFTIQGATEGLKIAPLLMIPFIENGFKHGVVNDKHNPFLIELTLHNRQLVLHTRNKIGNHHKDSGSGVGLRNVRRRLELLYPGRYHLAVTQNGDQYNCTLQLDLN